MLHFFLLHFLNNVRPIIRESFCCASRNVLLHNIVGRNDLACSAGVFFGCAICSRKRHVETSRREEEMGQVKGSGEGAGREKRKRLPENTVKMRNTS